MHISSETLRGTDVDEAVSWMFTTNVRFACTRNICNLAICYKVRVKWQEGKWHFLCFVQSADILSIQFVPAFLYCIIIDCLAFYEVNMENIFILRVNSSAKKNSHLNSQTMTLLFRKNVFYNADVYCILRCVLLSFNFVRSCCIHRASFPYIITGIARGDISLHTCQILWACMYVACRYNGIVIVNVMIAFFDFFVNFI